MLGWRTMPFPGPRSTRRRYIFLFSIWFLRHYTFSWRGLVEKDNFGTKQQPAIPPTASSQLFRLQWSNSIKLLSSAPLETAVGCQRCHWTVTKVVTFLILLYPVALDYVFDDVVANYLSISSTNLEKKREK
ncbi:hypothetical protein ACE6H2_005863 [Prunus campanulata]